LPAVTEDAAHALPTRRDGRLIGSWDSDVCVFSFYATKPITTGEGGMIVTRNPRIAERARIMRTHGLSRDAFDRFRKVGASWDYDVVAAGFKYNLTDVAAAIGVVQLSRAMTLQSARQRAALRYFERLAGLPLDCPAAAPVGGLHSWHLFPIRVHDDAPATRDDLITALSSAGIGTSVHYRPLHQMTYWKERYPSEPSDFVVADRYFAGAVTLPLFPGMTDAQVDRIADIVHQILG
jgi:dTDP-4-amino-4,6-dideoxygalactose transaminase